MKRFLFYWSIFISILKIIIRSFDKSKKLVKRDDFSFFTPEGWNVKEGQNYIFASNSSLSSNTQFFVFWYNYVFDHYEALESFIAIIKKNHKELLLFDFVIAKEIEHDEFIGIPAISLEMKYISEAFYLDNISKTYIIHTNQRTYVITKYLSEQKTEKELSEFKEIEQSFEFHEKFNPWNLDIFLN